MSEQRWGNNAPLADLKWVGLNSKKGDLTDVCTNQQHLNQNLKPTEFQVLNSQQRISISPKSTISVVKAPTLTFLRSLPACLILTPVLIMSSVVGFPSRHHAQTFKTWIIHHNDHNVSFNVCQSYIIVKLQVSELISSQMDSKSTLQQGFPVLRNARGERACKNTGEGILVFCMYFSLLLISDLKCLQQTYIFRLCHSSPCPSQKST